LNEYSLENAGIDCIMDQSGNKWWIATRKEDLSKEEIIKRMDDALKHQKQESTLVVKSWF
jgi:hypothetical protein